LRVTESTSNNAFRHARNSPPRSDQPNDDDPTQNLLQSELGSYARLAGLSEHGALRLGDSATRELGVGSSGAAVAALQDSLAAAGYDSGEIIGKFGVETLVSVKAYQQDRIESLENSLRNSPPPFARAELSRQIGEIRHELNTSVAGSETQSQLGVDTDLVVDALAVDGTNSPAGLQRGDVSLAVRELQNELNRAGYNVGSPDSDFGSRTESAVQSFQADRIEYLQDMQHGPMPPPDHALVSFKISRLENEMDSGVAGEETRSRLNQVLQSSSAAMASGDGPVRGLSEADFQSAADKLGVNVATVKAIAEVESLGSGFLESGDPTILFEAHIFSSRTGGIYNQSHPNISSRSWDRSLYGASGQHQHDRLASAIELDETAALASASWGTFQIMGFNHQAAGYDNVQDFVAAMRESESNQLDAFVGFIKSHPGMVTASKNRDWAGFARQYNGPGYAQNNYDSKMANAYVRHSS